MAQWAETWPSFLAFQTAFEGTISVFPDPSQLPGNPMLLDHFHQARATSRTVRFQTRWQIIGPAEVMAGVLVTLLKVEKINSHQRAPPE
ncbi:hypothetical protein KSZ_62170 [Dictyobacter formicarum]|uniref:Uncharacterized protein n=1 Tax=Dictyobacter formicarum TaxID=2778368 RepID=A0ABQ3VSA3_9CHLR|nr:hypothetical protein KSZ_62170 [Dictyobacter formicarum]